MRTEIADNSSGRGGLVFNFNPPLVFFGNCSGGLQHHASSLLFILPIFPRKMYTESCQTQMQIFVTLKLNKFTTEKCTARVENEAMCTFRAPAFCRADKFSTQRPINRTIYHIFPKEKTKRSGSRCKVITARVTTCNFAERHSDAGRRNRIHERRNELSIYFLAGKKRSPSRKQFNCRARLITADGINGRNAFIS